MLREDSLAALAVFAQHLELVIGDLQMEMPKATPACAVAIVFSAVFWRAIRYFFVAQRRRLRYGNVCQKQLSPSIESPPRQRRVFRFQTCSIPARFQRKRASVISGELRTSKEPTLSPLGR